MFVWILRQTTTTVVVVVSLVPAVRPARVVAVLLPVVARLSPVVLQGATLTERELVILEQSPLVVVLAVFTTRNV